MIKKKLTSAPRQTHLASLNAPAAYHYLDALLHTMRCIAQYEDALCELSHEVKRTGKLSPQIGDELREILEQIPSHDYVIDLDAVRATLPGPKPLKKHVSRKLAKHVPARKSSAVGKKKPGRKPSK
jgi:hypothetical protein